MTFSYHWEYPSRAPNLWKVERLKRSATVSLYRVASCLRSKLQHLNGLSYTHCQASHDRKAHLNSSLLNVENPSTSCPCFCFVAVSIEMSLRSPHLCRTFEPDVSLQSLYFKQFLHNHSFRSSKISPLPTGQSSTDTTLCKVCSMTHTPPTPNALATSTCSKGESEQKVTAHVIMDSPCSCPQNTTNTSLCCRGLP